MHQELVERRRWIGEGPFLHALSYCMLLPGPEATQLAIYVGWLLHGAGGGIAAGVLFVLPAFFVLLGLSWVYAVHGDVGWVAAVLDGLGPAVVGIVGAALIRVAGRTLRSGPAWAVAGAAFVLLGLVGVPFPAVVLMAGLLGLAVGRRLPGAFVPPIEPTEDGGPAGPAPRVGRGWRRSARVLAAGLLAWWGPLGLVALLRGPEDVLTQEALFFSQLAVVTFGGAYAVLAYLNQAAVDRFGWLAQGEMVTGLGLAETTPGPLIMVTEFVGFLAAYRDPGGLPPVLAGVLGAAVTTWATFAPSFLWILLGAPYVERLRGSGRLASGLGAITASVVGVIATLALTFGVHVLFARVAERSLLGAVVPVPDPASFDPVAFLVAAAVFLGVWRRGWSVPAVVAGSAAVGLLRAVLG